MKTNRTVKDEVLGWILADLATAKTPEDLEKVKALAADAVTGGLLPQEKIDEVFTRYAPE